MFYFFGPKLLNLREVTITVVKQAWGAPWVLPHITLSLATNFCDLVVPHLSLFVTGCAFERLYAILRHARWGPLHNNVVKLIITRRGFFAQSRWHCHDVLSHPWFNLGSLVQCFMTVIIVADGLLFYHDHLYLRHIKWNLCDEVHWQLGILVFKNFIFIYRATDWGREILNWVFMEDILMILLEPLRWTAMQVDICRDDLMGLFRICNCLEATLITFSFHSVIIA